MSRGLLTEDVAILSRIIKKLNITSKDFDFSSPKGATPEEQKSAQIAAVIDVVMLALSNIHLAIDEVCELVAVLSDKTVEEVKKQPLFETISTFQNVIGDIVNFFKSQVKLNIRK